VRNQSRTKEQLLDELVELRQRIADLEAAEAERKQAEEALQYRVELEELVAAISSAFVGLSSTEVDGGINDALRAIGQFAGVDRSYVFQLSDDGTEMDNTYEWCAPGIEPQMENLQGLPVDAFPWWMEKLSRFETIHIPRVADLPPGASAEREILQSQGIQSLLAVPLGFGGALVGFLGFDSVRAARTWPEADIWLLSPVGETIASALQRKRAEERLRLQAVLLEQIRDSIVATDLHGRITYVNEAAARALGVTKEELIGQTVLTFGEDADRGATQQEIIDRTLADGSWRGTVVNYDRAGSERIMESRTWVVHDGPGTPKGMVGVSTDVTARAQAEAALRRSLEQTARGQRLLLALSQVAQAVQRAHTPEEVYRTIADEIAGLGYHATIFALSDDRTHLVASRLTFGSALVRVAEKLTGLSAQGYRFPLKPGGFFERIMDEGETVFTDPGTGPVVDALPGPVHPLAGRLAAVLGIDKAIYAPLTVDGVPQSLLTVMGADLTEADVPAMSTFASQAATAIENARLYQALRESEERFRRAVVDAPFPIMIHAEDGEVVQINKVWTELSGYPADQIPTMADWTERAYGERQELVKAGIDRLYGLDARVAEGEYVLKTSAGDERTWEFSSAPLGQLPDGRRMVISMAMDITERKRIEEQLRRQERLAAVGQLATGIAHDFRNLLTTIILCAQMPLRRTDLPPDLRRSLETIVDESHKATDLVQQILDFSSRAMIQPKPLDLASFAGDVLAVLRRTIPESVRLTLEAGPGDCTVKADSGRMQQVLTNLALNARDAMPGGGELSIRVERVVTPIPQSQIQGCRSEAGTDGTHAGRAWVCLSVSDTGTGMTEEVQAHLFEPFFTTKEPGEGTGLGLAQVYGIVRQHGGQIDVETALGAGTTFRIYLPASEAAEAHAGERVVSPAVPRGQGETILLVEDEERVRDVGRSALESLGYRVITAENGRVALDAYRSADRVELVITDLVMPEVGGKELVRELKRGGAGPKAVAITGYAVGEVARDLRQAGFLDVIRKPFEVDVLARAVRRALDAG